MLRLALVLSVLMVVSWAGLARAQSPDKTVFVPYGVGEDDGYTFASIQVRYRFIECMGEVHIAYSLVPDQIRASPTYRFKGRELPVPSGSPPQQATIVFAGKVMDGPVPIGTFADGLAAPALGMGCFSGQSQKIGLVKDLVGARTAPEQVAAFLARLTASPRPIPTRLTSADVEDRLAQAARKAEADKRAESRKAEAEAKEAEAFRLARDRKRKGEAERALADAKAAEEKARAEREVAERLLAEATRDGPVEEVGVPAKAEADSSNSNAPAAMLPARTAAVDTRTLEPVTSTSRPARMAHAFCVLRDRPADARREQRYTAYITSVFEFDEGRIVGDATKPVSTLMSEAFRTHITSQRPVRSEASGGCHVFSGVSEAQAEHDQETSAAMTGIRARSAEGSEPNVQYSLTESNWRPYAELVLARQRIGFCSLEDRVANAPPAIGGGMTAYLSDVFETDDRAIGAALFPVELVSQAWEKHVRSRHLINPKARGWCHFWTYAGDARQEREWHMQGYATGLRPITKSLVNESPQMAVSHVDWRPGTEPGSVQMAVAPQPEQSSTVNDVTARPAGGLASAVAPTVGSSTGESMPSTEPQEPEVRSSAADAAAAAARVKATADNAARRVRDEAEAEAGAARLKAYHDQVEAQRLAYEAEVARVAATYAEAQKRHAEKVAAAKRQHEAAMADWAACKAGDRARCAAR